MENETRRKSSWYQAEIALLLLGAICLAAGCGGRPTETTITEGGDTPSAGQAFSIYLAAGSRAAFEHGQDSLGDVELQQAPLLTADDLLSYCWRDHSFELQRDVELPEPGFDGLLFVVKSQRERQYVGGFWSLTSSLAPTEPAIYVDTDFDDGSGRRLFIEQGLHPEQRPASDPRENPTIRQALQAAGKLQPGCLPSLPKSMKGWERYSWKPRLPGDDWRFVLIAGTNRNKTCEEIVTGPDIAGIKTTSFGVEGIKATLARLPSDESVFWSPRLPQCELSLPEPEVVAELEAFCVSHGVELATF